MFVHAHPHVHMEILKWIALLAIASSLGMFFASSTAGAELTRPPGLLPPNPAAQPMIAPDDPMAELPDSATADPYAMALETWNAIQLHQEGHLTESVEAWMAIDLPAHAEEWRQIAIGMAWCQLGDLDRAEVQLRQVTRDAPHNPLGYYAYGLVALMRSELADEWYDAAGWNPMQLANHVVNDERPVPKTSSVYRLTAMMAFRDAVRYADMVDLNEPLFAGEWITPPGDPLGMPVTVPTFRDVVAPFGGDRFEGRSHLGLGQMYMEVSALDAAEEHLDAAADLGEPTGATFRELGERLENEGHYGGAMRAYLKAVSHGGGIACAQDALTNLGRAMFGF